LITRIQSEEMDEIAFGEDGRKSKVKEKSAPGKSLKEKLAPVFAKVSSFFPQLGGKLRIGITLKKPDNFSKMLKSAGAGALLFLICACAAILARGPLTHAFPATALVFAALGLEGHEETPSMSMEDMLAIDHLSLDEEGHDSALLTGTLINLTSSEVQVPSIMVEIIDKENKVLWSEKLELSAHPLQAEDQLDFKVKLEKIPTEGGQRLELRFDQENEDSHSSVEGEG